MDGKEKRYLELGLSSGQIKVKMKTPLFGLALIFFLFSYLSSDVVSETSLDKLEDQVIENPPRHKEYSGGKSGRHYSCKIKLENSTHKFVIDGIDYQYVNFEGLYRNIRKGDVVSLLVYKDDIYSLKKDGVDYCNLEAANEHRKNNKASIRWIAGIASIFFGFGAILERFKKVREYYNNKIKFSWGCLSVGVVIISFFAINLFIGARYVTNRYDHDKSYKEILRKYEYRPNSG